MGLSLMSKYSKDYDMGYATFYCLRRDIANFVCETPKQGTISFLEQNDCEGKLTPKECIELLNDIQDMPDQNKYYGYVGRGTENCLTITLLKDLLQSCVSHRCNLKWF